MTVPNINPENVAAGPGKITGYAFTAPAYTELAKEDAVTDLPAAFESLGAISEDGIVNNNSRSSTKVKDWAGNTVRELQEEKEDTFEYTMIEALSINVLKEVFGPDNVSEKGGITTAKANAEELPTKAYVFDTMLSGNIPRRMYIPCAKVSEVGEVAYKGTEAIGYKVKLSCYPDANGNTHYEHTGTVAAE